MARTAEEVKQSYIDNVETVDDSIQVDTGPITDAVVTPVSSEIAIVEAQAERLAQLNSTEFIRAQSNESELQAFVTNYTLADGGGRKSSGTVFFARFSTLPAGEDVVIPIGTFVANISGSLIYQTTEERTISGDNINSFFNAGEGLFEIAVPVEAIAQGERFDLPATRIRTLLTPIPGIDTVINRSPISNGKDPEDKERTFERVQNAFTGQDKGSQAGLASLVEDFDTTAISSVALVRSSERDLFRRFVNQLAIDVYINGSTATQVVEEFTLTQDRNFVIPTNQPLIAIVSVTVDGTNDTGVQLEKDATVLAQSTRAQDRIVLSSTAVAGSVINVTYTYNSLLTNVTTNVFGAREDNLFDVDMLARQMLENKIALQATIKASSSSTPDSVQAATDAALRSLIVTNQSGAVYTPEIIRQQLLGTVVGLSEFTWTKFTSTTNGTLNIEIVDLEKNEIAIIDEDEFLIRI